MTKYNKFTFSNTFSANSKRQDEKVVVLTADFTQLRNRSISKIQVEKPAYCNRKSSKEKVAFFISKHFGLFFSLSTAAE